MHLSKRVLYIGIIGFAATMLVTQDWPAMIGTTGGVSAAWLAKMFADVLFIGMAGVRLLGPAFFADDESDDEVAIHEEDLHVSDTALFGVFLLNVLGNGAYHAYVTVTVTGAESFYYSMWTMVEGVALFLSWVLWSHAVKAQKKLARRSREAQAATAGGATNSAPAAGPTALRRAQ